MSSVGILPGQQALPWSPMEMAGVSRDVGSSRDPIFFINFAIVLLGKAGLHVAKFAGPDKDWSPSARRVFSQRLGSLCVFPLRWEHICGQFG